MKRFAPSGENQKGPFFGENVVFFVFFTIIIATAAIMVYSNYSGKVPQVYAAGGVPTTSAVVIDYRNTASTVVLSFDEEVKTTTSATNNFDLSKVHLRNTVGGTDLVSLSSNTITETASSTTVTITLTEAQRVTLIQSSAVTGGDAGEIVVVIDAEAAYSGATDQPNVSGVPIAAGVVTETADNVKPTITSATINYNDNSRAVVVTFSETVKSSSLSLAKFHLNDATGTDWPLTDLTGASVTAATSTTLTITLTEAQRASLIVESGVAGGDGGALVLDVDASGIKDIGKNLNDTDDNNTVTETADTNAPTVSSLNTGSGGTSDVAASETIVVTFSEAMNTSGLTVVFSSNSGFNTTPVWTTNNTVATFSPSGSLPSGQSISFTITAAPDLGTNALGGGLTMLSFRVMAGGGGSAASLVSAPASATVVINNGSTTTNNKQVLLSLTASNTPKEVMVSSKEDFVGAVWVAYVPAMNWTFDATPGEKTVYVKFRNESGTSGVASAKITLQGAGGAASSDVPSTESAPATGESVPAASGGQHAGGTLILGADRRTVYLVEDGKLRPFRDKVEFESHGYKFGDVVEGTEADWVLPMDKIKKAAVDSLIKITGDPTVWIVDNNDVIHGFRTYKSFLDFGFDPHKIKIISSLAGYKEGTPIPAVE